MEFGAQGYAKVKAPCGEFNNQNLHAVATGWPQVLNLKETEIGPSPPAGCTPVLLGVRWQARDASQAWRGSCLQ